MQVSLEHVSPAPVDRTFAVVSDIARRPSWVGVASERTRIVDGPVGAGAEYRAVDRFPGRRVEYVQRVERFVPNELFEESWDGPMSGRSTIRFRDEGDGTRLVIDADITLPRPLSLVPTLARVLGRLAIKVDLRRLDRVVAASTD